MSAETWTQEDMQRYARGEHVPKQKAKYNFRGNGWMTFTIPGLPIGKPRMTRRDKWKQRTCVVRYREWADSAREAAGELPDIETIERLDWVAYFPPPSSWSKKKRSEAIGTLHRSRPDRDNIDKAVLDSLFECDSAIACGTIRKVWGEPARLEVAIQCRT